MKRLGLTKAKRQSKVRRLFPKTCLALLGLWLLGWFALPWAVDLPALLKGDPPQGVVFLDREGRSLRSVPVEDQRALEPVTFEEIPEALAEAIVAVEDQRFWGHGGIDFIGVARALRDNYREEKRISGASSITQQLAKVGEPRPRPPRNLRTKIVESLVARQIEMSLTKEEILAAYLNRIEFGNGFTGIRAAAEGYFGKPLSDLSTSECALLAGLPQSPSRLDPVRNPWESQVRRDHVLTRMHTEGYLSPAQLAVALREPLRLDFNKGGFEAPHAVDQLLADHIGSGPIETTLDLNLQRLAERIIAEQLEPLKDKNGRHAAVVILDNATGDVLALVGSGHYADEEGGQINGAWVPHPAGSTLKPITYLLALQEGWRASDLIDDLPRAFSTNTGLYQPVNYDRRFHGPVTLRDALAGSLNVSAVTLLNDVGGVEALHGSMEAVGFSNLHEKPEHYGLGLTLGNASVRLLELANAYSTIARAGEWRPWKLEQNESGETPHQVFDPVACWLLADILSDNRARTRSFGPRSALRTAHPVAVKTGTSSDFRDNWTVGFDPRHTVAVWVGNFDNSPMREISGVTGAAPIFRALFEELHRREEPVWFPRPDGLAERWIDMRTGKQLNAAQREALPVDTIREEIFLSTNLPNHAEPSDYDEEGRALLPDRYRRWLEGTDNARGAFLAVRPEGRGPMESESGASWIASPSEGAVYFLDPDLPQGGQRLSLKTRNGLRISNWKSETLQLEVSQSGTEAEILLQPGRHEIAIQSEKGDWHRISFEVEAL